VAEESISERQAIIDALLRKHPELVVPGLTIRHDRLLDEHPFYAGIAASAFTTEQETVVLSGSLGPGQSEQELALTSLHETYHVLHAEGQGAGKEERAEEFARARWHAIQAPYEGKI
jgi:hypothetical protein